MVANLSHLLKSTKREMGATPGSLDKALSNQLMTQMPSLATQAQQPLLKNPL
jgi:hypothetical protein